ncbi:MAG: N-acetyltransferase [Ferruginibacter sp.]|nr:N-acetyltransferase [Ferruginibacter sp.]
MKIVSIQPVHYPQIAAIYLQGIATGHATFQTSAPTWSDWDSSHLKHSRVAAFIGNDLAGWAALSPVSSRCVYEGVAEVSVYIADNYRGKGIGKALLQQLIADSEANNTWTLQSGIFPENTGSIRLHESCGFRQIGFREKIGKMNGVWRDNIIMERRSKIVGL